MPYNKKSLENLLHWDKKKIETVEEFHKKCVEYFQLCLRDEICPVISGLVFHLGFSHSSCLDDYKGYKDKNNNSYSYTIEQARLFIRKCKEEWLVSGKGSTAGLKFDLINNYGWQDKSSVDHTTKGDKISISPIKWIDDSSDKK